MTAPAGEQQMRRMLQMSADKSETIQASTKTYCLQDEYSLAGNSADD